MSPDGDSTPPPAFSCVVRMPSTSPPAIDRERSASPSESETNPTDVPRRDRLV